MIYLDNAATSFPKPETVLNAVRDYMAHIGANPGRSGHRLSASAGRIVFDTRQALSELLGAADARQIIFTANATEAINLALSGLLQPADHVVTTAMEHNAMMRPLNHLAESRGIEVSVAACDGEGRLELEALAAALTPKTRLVAVNHASNVCGTIMPLAEIRRAIGDAWLLVDAAQTAGALPLDVQDMGIDLLAFTGHKSLLGPQGTGGLYIRPGLDERLTPLIRGGTGSSSEHEVQPTMLPDRFESGTRNTPGLAGLGAGVRYLMQRGVDDVRRHETGLTGRLLDGLRRIPHLTLYGPADPLQRVPVVSFNVAGLAPSEVGLALDRRYDIMVRAGLHCAPAAHRTLGTFPEGTVRLGVGVLNTAAEVDEALRAIREIAKEARA